MEATIKEPFVYLRRIRLAQTDAAGVVFFTRPLELVHEAYEAFLDAAGIGVRALLDAGTALPVVEASIRLLAPLRVGDDVAISLSCERLGEHSFILRARLRHGEQLAAEGRTVHVSIDALGRTTPLPTLLIDALSALPEARRGDRGETA